MPDPSATGRASIRAVGAVVHAKATSITSEAECVRRYGAKKREKKLKGTVLQAVFKSNSPDGSGRKQWWITAKFELGGGAEKTVELNSRSASLIKSENHLCEPFRSSALRPKKSTRVQ